MNTVRALEAVLWDVDGTIAETERDGHRVAFNLAFEAFGLPWRWDSARYGELLGITGGRERLIYDMQNRPDAPPAGEKRQALARSLHAKKNAFYAELLGSTAIPTRGGVVELMRECREWGVRMAITTTTSRVNVDALMRRHLGDRWTDWFGAIVCGEDVKHKKPDPEVFCRALQLLGIEPRQTVAMEDSPSGAAAARAADCPVVVTRSFYFAAARIDGAIAIGPGLHTRADWCPRLRSSPQDQRVALADIVDWLAQRHLVCNGSSVSG